MLDLLSLCERSTAMCVCVCVCRKIWVVHPNKRSMSLTLLLEADTHGNAATNNCLLDV